MIPANPPTDDVSALPQAPVVAPVRPIRLQHYLFVAGTVLAIAALLHWLGPILTPFFIGAILAYLGRPALTWGERRRVPRTVGTLLIIALILLILLGLGSVRSPLAPSEFMRLTEAR